MDVLFVMEGDDIKDIFHFELFKTELDIEKLGTKADINFNLDDQITGLIHF